jgi:hypothetical protein
MRHRLLPIILLLGLCSLGMGKKELPLSIRFYTQTTQGDSDSFSAPVKMLNGKETYVDQVASISERDIAAVQPSVAADGSGACLIQLDDHGTMALDSLSVAKKGSLLLAFINAHQVLDILIDQRVSDGRLWISSGITTAEMKLILKKYPLIGGKKEAKKQKKDIYSTGL